MQLAISPQDGIVYPQLEQLLPNTGAKIFPGLGHLELCQASVARHWVVDQLQDLKT
jgi:hypothetical protein